MNTAYGNILNEESDDEDQIIVLNIIISIISCFCCTDCLFF